MNVYQGGFRMEQRLRDRLHRYQVRHNIKSRSAAVVRLLTEALDRDEGKD